MNNTLLYTKLKGFGAFKGLSEKGALQLVEQFKVLKSGTKSKYNNMIVEYDGARYHSLSEAYYHHLLKSDKRIIDIKTQVRFKLENMEGKKTLSYVADFVVLDTKNQEYVIDVKGRLTNENKVKLGYFYYVYKKPVVIVETSGLDKFNLNFLG